MKSEQSWWKKETERGVWEQKDASDLGKPEARHTKSESSSILREPFFKPWLLWPLKPWDARRGRIQFPDRDAWDLLLLFPFIPGEPDFPPLLRTGRSWAGGEQLKALDSFHTEPLGYGSMTTNATAAFSEAAWVGKWLQSSIAGSPSGIELETGDRWRLRKEHSTDQAVSKEAADRGASVECATTDPQQGETAKVRGTGLLFN